MKKSINTLIVGIWLCLLILSTVLPATAHINNKSLETPTNQEYDDSLGINIIYVDDDASSDGDGSLKNLGGIARYNISTKTWHALPADGTASNVNALERSGSDLYVGGYFTKTGDSSITNLGHIARYETHSGTWHALPNHGFDKDIWALRSLGDNLLVGGKFTQTSDSAFGELGNIARLALDINKGYLPFVIK